MKKSPKLKPEVSGATGVIETLNGIDALIYVNDLYEIALPASLLPKGAKVGDSVICRFQLVKRQNDK